MKSNAKDAVVTRYSALIERHVHVVFDAGPQLEALLQEITISIPGGRHNLLGVVRHWVRRARA